VIRGTEGERRDWSGEGEGTSDLGGRRCVKRASGGEAAVVGEAARKRGRNAQRHEGRTRWRSGRRG
jgi:hypothetical protein